MLKYINSMSAIHWLLIGIALFTLMSLGKLAAGAIIIVALIACLVRYFGSISTVFNRLFGKVLPVTTGDRRSSADADKGE